MDDAVTIAQAADLMGLHKNTVRQWIKLGKLPASKVKTDRGETYLIPRAALDQPHLNGHEQPTVSDAPAPIPTVNVPANIESVIQRLFHPALSELQAAHRQIGVLEERVRYLEAQLAQATSTLPAPSPKLSWWDRLRGL